MKKKTEIQHYRGLYVQEHRRPYGSAHIIYHILKSSEGKWIARSSCPYHHLCRCKKNKLIALLANDMESDSNEIIEIYRKRWEIELPFKQIKRNHSIFRHDNFIGCFSADKIKMSARKYFCFNIPIDKNMAEGLFCRSPYHEEYIQTSASGNPEDLCH